MKNTPQWFRAGFVKYFPYLNFTDCMDLMLVRLGKGCHIDIFKFEAELETNHGKIPDGVSINDFLVEHYGNEAAEWAREAL